MPYSDLSVRREKQRQYNQTYYKTHPRQRAELNKLARQRNRVAVKEYVKTHPCIDCGEAESSLLEFDHVRGEKKAAVVDLVNRPCSLQTILAEIDKCEVRCVRCHRLKTAKEQGWYRAKPVSLSDISTPATLP